MKQELLKDVTGTLSLIPYLANRPAVPSSATVTVTKPGGEVLVTAASATINSSTGEITYSLSSTYTVLLGENYEAQWQYVVGGTTYYQTSLFDVVLHRLAISVVDDDLLQEQSDILDRNEAFSGVVDSAAAGTLVANNLKSYVDDYWNGGKVIIINPSTGAEQMRTVSDFVQSTGTISIPVNWATTPDSTYTFAVKRGFATKIEKAFEEMMLDVQTRGYRPALIIESSELKIPLIKKALALVCRDYITTPDDKWEKLAVEYDTQYRDMFAKIQFQYDRDESGYISGQYEKNQDLGSVRLRR